MDLKSALSGAFAQAGDNAVAAAQATLQDAALGAFTQAQAAVPIPTGAPPQVSTTSNTQPGAAVSPALTKPSGMAGLPRWVKLTGVGALIVGAIWLFRKKWK